VRAGRQNQRGHHEIFSEAREHEGGKLNRQ